MFYLCVVFKLIVNMKKYILVNSDFKSRLLALKAANLQLLDEEYRTSPQTSLTREAIAYYQGYDLAMCHVLSDLSER